MGQRLYNFDAAMQLKDAGLLAASGRAQVAGLNQILDLGVGRLEGTVIFDVTALEIDSANESYTFVLQGSNDATFATGIENLAIMNVGAKGARTGFVGTTSIDSPATGRYEMPFVNEQNDIRYQYISLYTVIAGTIATGANFTAWISARPGE